MSDTHEIVSLRNISLSYDSIEVFRDVSFVLAKGDFYYLTGESGAGKTSLLRLIYLDNFAYQGKIKLFEQNIKFLPRRLLPQLRHRIGVVKQEPGLLEHLTILQNTMLPLLIQGFSEAKASRRAYQVLSWIGLQNFIDQHPDMLSGGHKQMTALARALVINPSLLIADEPTGNLDMRNARKLMKIFEHLHKMGTTIIMATHNQSIVKEFPHPEIRLEHGRLVFVQEAETSSQTGTNDATPTPETSADSNQDKASHTSINTQSRYSSFHNRIDP